VTAAANGQWSCNLVDAAPGAHSVVVASTVLNATETATAVSIEIDPTAPAAPVIVVPASGALLTASPAAISGTAEPESEVTVREGTNELCSATADAAGQWSCAPAPALGEGTHTVTATATDDVGNAGPASAPSTFTIDGTAPDTSFTTQPPARTSERNAAFAYASTEDHAHFECSLDAATFAACSDVYAVGAGDHVLRARAVDAAGNVDASPAEARWTVEVPHDSPDASTPGEPEPAPTPTTPSEFPAGGGGCSVSPGEGLASTGSAVAPLVFGLLFLRRSSRRRSAR
jgi:MYXO-CTERM domain-containing protein